MNWSRFEQRLGPGNRENSPVSRLSAGITLTVILSVLSLVPVVASKAATVDTLDNGLEVIYVENHASPLAASIVYVRSGSRYETEYENGITHFLEHLLFDGTVHLTREELDNSIQRLGGYINAFTTKDMTAYVVVMPREFIGYGLAVQADMLFNSVFPEDEVEKERKVVIEEISRWADSPGAAAEAFFESSAYEGSGYARPVLGYSEFIANLPREAIVDYWKTHYTPDRMTVLVNGDFETPKMAEQMAAAFGPIKGATKTGAISPLDAHRKLAEGKQRIGQLAGAVRRDTVGNVTSTYVNLSIDAPAMGDRDYLPLDILSRYLNTDGISPLKTLLAGAAEPLSEEVSVSLSTHQDFSRLNVGALVSRPELADSAVALILSGLRAIAETGPDSTAFEAVKTSVRCEAIMNSERLHYLGFLIASQLMGGGWNFVESYPEQVASVSSHQCQAAAGRWLSNPNYVATVMRPADSSQRPFVPRAHSADEVRTYFDTVAVPEHDLTVGQPVLFPLVDSVQLRWRDPAVYHREVLPNGLTVLIRSNRGSRAFGAALLGKDRTMREPDGQVGITEFVNRCLEKGTRSRSAEILARDLAAIGAEVTLYDNPWIPYDDLYTCRSFSFLKLQTVDDYAEDGLMLLADMVNHPAFDSAAVEKVRAELAAVIERYSRSPQKTAGELFYATLFEGGPFARPILGTVESINAITQRDLQDYHEYFYAPDNSILALATNRDTSEVMDWVRTFFGYRTRKGIDSTTGPDTRLVLATETVTKPLESQQVAIYAGGRLPGAGAEEATELRIAIEILSDRLYKNLRERQGLAYSTGATSCFDREIGWYYAYIGSAGEQYGAARDGLQLQTEKLAFDGPSQEEVRRAANQIWGQMLRAKTTRANQAYYMAVDEFVGHAPGHDALLVGQLTRSTPASVRQVASRYFRPALWVVAAAGKLPQ